MWNHLIVTCNNVTNHGGAEGQGAVRPPPTVMVSVGLRTWIALYPFLPAQTPFLYINVVLKRRKPVRIFAPHSFIYHTRDKRGGRTDFWHACVNGKYISKKMKCI